MASVIPPLSRITVRARDLFRCLRCGCPTPAGNGHWHHRRSRSIVDTHQHTPCNGIWLCSTCHTWVHSHPLIARIHGWIVSRYANPCEVPVEGAQHGWVLLGHEGGVTPTTDPREDDA